MSRTGQVGIVATLGETVLDKGKERKDGMTEEAQVEKDDRECCLYSFNARQA